MSSEITVNENDLQDLLEEVQRDLSVLLKSDRLAKADEKKPDEKEKKEAKADDKSPAAEVAPKEEAPKDTIADDSAPAAAADPIDESAMAPAGEVTPEESMEAAPGEPSEEMAADMPPEGMGEAIEPAPSIEALQAEYEQLPENELMMHLCAAHAACLARGGLGAQPEASMDPMAAPEAAGMDMGAPAPAPAPEMAAPAPAMPPEEEMAPEPAMKGELEMKGKVNPSAGEGSGNAGWKEGGGLKKSEHLELQALKAKVADQEKALMELVNFATTPFRKSVKNLSEVKDVSETALITMNKSQIQAKLLEQSKNRDLKKSDRTLINGYYEGTVKIEQLEHLLKG